MTFSIYQSIWLALFFLVSCAWSLDCTHEPAYIIRHIYSGLILEATDDTTVAMAHFKEGNDNQLWGFETANEEGLFYIINKGVGNLLDITRTADCTNDDRCYVVLGARDTATYQQWYVHPEQHIVNANTHYYLDIIEKVYEPGAPLQTYACNDETAQDFQIEKLI